MVRARNVVLNALFLDPSASGGPATYLRGLALALRDARPDATLTVVTTRRGAASLRAADWPGRGIDIRELPCDEGQRLRRQVCEQLLLPRLARTLRADVLHSLASVAPLRVRGIAHVITVHDVIFIHHDTFNAITTWGMRQVVSRAAPRADGLIAVTATARDDICATLGLPAGAFTVIHEAAVDVGELQTPSRDGIRQHFGLGDGRVVLCVGAKRPHKNQELLVRALPHLPPDVRLVLVGHPEPYEQSLRALTRDLGFQQRVSFIDWVSEEHLEGLWAVSHVAALPTLAEGFGLPLLEAMARGVPVAAADLPVFRELGDGWPVYFDPRDPRDAARAVLALLEAPPDPQAARSLAARFSWSAAAESTWEVYDRALSRTGASSP